MSAREPAATSRPTDPADSSEAPTASSTDSSARGSLLHRIAFGLVAILPLAAMFLPPYIGGLPAKDLGFQLLAYGALFCGLCGRSTPRSTPRTVPFTPGTVGLFLLLLAGVLSSLHAGSPDVTTRALGFLGAIVAAHVAALITINTERRFAIVAAITALGAVSLSGFGIHGLFQFKEALANGSATEASRSELLATSFFRHSYLAAQAVLSATLVLIGFLLAKRQTSHPSNGSAKTTSVLRTLGRWLVVVGVLAVPVAFLGAVFSRGAWGAFGIALSIIIVGALYRAARIRRADRIGRLASPLRWLIPCTIAVVGGLLVLALAAREGSFGPTAQAATARIASLLDPELRVFNFSRILVWQDALRIAGDAAPLGIGPGLFSQAFGEIHTGPRPLSHAHNQFLHTFAELGALGLAALCLALLQPVIGAVQELARIGPKAHPRAALAVIGSTSAIALLCLFESPLLFPAVAAQLGVISGAASRLCGGRVRVGSGWLRGTRLEWSRALGIVALVALLIGVGPPIWRHTRASLLGAAARDSYDQQDLGSASELAIRALQHAPEHAEVLALLGRIMLDAGDAAGTDETYRRYLTESPGQTAALYTRAVALRRLGRFEEAIHILQIAQNRAPEEDVADYQFLLGTTLFDARRYEEARLLFSDLVRRNVHGKHLSLFLRLAETLMNLGQNRALARQLLLRYAAVVSESEASYARSLIADLDLYYRPSPPPGGEKTEDGDPNGEG